ncbi:MAG: bacillithiol biosynthesis cysteine-adding enzyme BshC [Flavobacteriales bacterium]
MNGDIPLKSTSFYKSLVTDYLNQNEVLSSFTSGFPALDNFERSIENKFMPPAHRAVLSSVLTEQYKGLAVNTKVSANINLLKDSRTFTVCTGHQLNVFTGPLYFLIKIAQTISLARSLKTKYPGYNFVPVYWMATEDHDLEEINHFHLFGSKKEWSTSQTGAVGRMYTSGLEKLAEHTSQLFQRSPEALSLLEEIKASYVSAKTLSQATRALVHTLFKGEELVILDADSPKLKTLFAPLMERELADGIVYERLNQTNELLVSKGYHVQVNPREINLFYLTEGLRTRIVKDGIRFRTNDDSATWSESELMAELHRHPERFSPNAAFRPVYQELILPNIANVGGPGEVSYWLQLKNLFDVCKVDFPHLVMRNSYSFISEKSLNTVTEFHLEFRDLLQRTEDLMKQATLSSADFSLESELAELKKLFTIVSNKVELIDPNLLGRAHSVLSSAEKQLSQLESKVVKSIKTQQETGLNRLKKVQDQVFPNGALAERSINFLELLNYMSWKELKEILLENDVALDATLKVIRY